jgi:dihydropteroate synthase
MTANFTTLLPPQGQPAIMGILNITPDSFSDGGRFFASGAVNSAAVLAHAESMVEAGVDIFDVGGESTRPGATPISKEEELARVLPVVKLLKARFPHPVSVDTSNPVVINAVAAAGADMINDVRALTRPGALPATVAAGLPVCLMHMPAEPPVMQQQPFYHDVVAEVLAYLRQRVRVCLDAGIPAQAIAIDPGFGFGKTLEHNLALFRALPEFVESGYPVLVGVSRKRMIGEILDRPVEQRVVGSVALAMMAAQHGAAMVRVHDVEATADALAILRAVNREVTHE